MSENSVQKVRVRSSATRNKILGNLFAILLLAALIYKSDLQLLIDTFSKLNLEIVCLLMLISVLLVYVSALKWSYFVKFFGTKISVLHLFNLYLVGYFINLVVPSYLGGDAVRSWYAGKKAGQHQALVSTILERYTGFLAMVVLALCFVWFAHGVTIEVKFTIVGLGAALVGLTVVSLSPRLVALVRTLPKGNAIAPHLDRIQEGLHLAKSNLPLLSKALALSFFFHTVTIANTLTAAYAVGWYEAPLRELFVVVPIILLIGSLPVTPGGLGLQEGAFFYFLQGIGATAPEALGIGLVLRAKSYILAIVGGVLWLFVRRGNNQAGARFIAFSKSP